MIPVCEPSLGWKEYYYVFKAMRSNWLTCGGEFIDRFEKGVAQKCGARYGVALSSGTAALHMALLALGIGKGDEVIVPSLSFVAVASMVKLCGATAVIVDVKRDSWLIDRVGVARAKTDKTKAVIVVDLYGTVCDVGNIRTYAPDVPIIVDACESLGAARRSIGDIMCLSFQSTKTLTCGEGGMCVTNNKYLSERVRFLKDHAMTPERKYFHPEVGFNYRMTELQAAIGVAQLEKLDGFLQKKAQINRWYEDELRGYDLQCGHSDGSNWVFPLLVSDRDRLMAELKRNGVESRVMFYPIHLQPPYMGKQCPNAEEISFHGLYLPSGVKLKYSEVRRICEIIRQNA